MTDSDRIGALERRLSSVEDQLAIYQLLMTYGPSADSGSSDVVRSIHADDAVYDAGVGQFLGADAIAEMIDAFPMHREIIAGGSAHVMTLPVIRIEGDRAHALCYGQLMRYDESAGCFTAWRMTSVQVEFRRVDGRWKIQNRTNHLLDGTPESHEHLRSGLRTIGAVVADTDD